MNIGVKILNKILANESNKCIKNHDCVWFTLSIEGCFNIQK